MEINMNETKLVEISKFLSFVLRHKPEAIGIVLSPEGWITVDELLRAATEHGKTFSRETLDEVVFSNDKQRFAFSADGKCIRANQGHSVEVDLQLRSQAPPELLYHGTATRFLEAIRKDGLLKMSRHHVHLAADPGTAWRVGARHGSAVILEVDAGRMAREGHVFFLSANGVWLVDVVPRPYLGGLD
jgi:putative RNA 2'-phosphotransferase